MGKRTTPRRKMLMVRVFKRKTVPGKHGGRLGRPRGAKSKVPGRVRASVKALVEEVVAERALTIKHAIIRGLRAEPRDSHHFIEFVTHYTDGKPGDTLTLKGKFTDDELAAAEKRLKRKFESMLKVALTSHDPSPSPESSSASTSTTDQQSGANHHVDDDGHSSESR